MQSLRARNTWNIREAGKGATLGVLIGWGESVCFHRPHIGNDRHEARRGKTGFGEVVISDDARRIAVHIARPPDLIGGAK